MTNRLLIIMLVGGVLSSSALAQPDPPSPPDERPQEQVRATIESLFDALRAGDSTAVRAVFDENARLHTARGPKDTTALESTSVDYFVEIVGQPRERVWDERIWDVEVRVDGSLASAWVPYAFYHGDEFSHCGVNAMQFVLRKEGWKILQLTDTRRVKCEIPEEVRK